MEAAFVQTQGILRKTKENIDTVGFKTNTGFYKGM